MPPKRRRRVDTHGWPTRELILLEASRLFATRGYLGTSTRDIATAVGIQQPSMYSHFASKHAIADELLQRNLSAGNEALLRIAADGGGPALELYRYLRWEIQYDLTDPFDFRALFHSEVLDLPEHLRDPEGSPQRPGSDALGGSGRRGPRQVTGGGRRVTGSRGLTPPRRPKTYDSVTIATKSVPRSRNGDGYLVRVRCAPGRGGEAAPTDAPSARPPPVARSP